MLSGFGYSYVYAGQRILNNTIQMFPMEAVGFAEPFYLARSVSEGVVFDNQCLFDISFTFTFNSLQDNLIFSFSDLDVIEEFNKFAYTGDL